MYTLSLLKVPVRDLEEAVPFYRDVLGMPTQFVAAAYGWAQLSAGQLAIALYVPGQGGGDGPVGGTVGFHLGLPPDAFEELVDRLQGAGALVDGRVHRGNDGSVFVDVRDPDGNLLKVMRCADDPPTTG